MSWWWGTKKGQAVARKIATPSHGDHVWSNFDSKTTAGEGKHGIQIINHCLLLFISQTIRKKTIPNYYTASKLQSNLLKLMYKSIYAKETKNNNNN